MIIENLELFASGVDPDTWGPEPGLPRTGLGRAGVALRLGRRVDGGLKSHRYYRRWHIKKIINLININFT